MHLIALQPMGARRWLSNFPVPLIAHGNDGPPMTKKSLNTIAANKSEKPKSYVLALYNPLDDSEPIDVIASGTESDLPSFSRDIAEFCQLTESNPRVLHCLGIFACEATHD